MIELRSIKVEYFCLGAPVGQTKVYFYVISSYPLKLHVSSEVCTVHSAV
jgi:hypothetical protein